MSRNIFGANVWAWLFGGGILFESLHNEKLKAFLRTSFLSVVVCFSCNPSPDVHKIIAAFYW